MPKVNTWPLPLLPSSSAGHVNLERDPLTMKPSGKVIDSSTFTPSSWVHGDHGNDHLISLDHFQSRMNFGGAFHRAQEIPRAFYTSPTRSALLTIFFWMRSPEMMAS